MRGRSQRPEGIRHSAKPLLSAANPSESSLILVAHGPQNLSVAIINRVFYAIWRDSVYGDLRGRVRLKAQIHDSLFYCFRGADTPDLVRQRMAHSVQVTDIKGKTRTMLIPPDMSIGDGNAKFWSDIK